MPQYYLPSIKTINKIQPWAMVGPVAMLCTVFTLLTIAVCNLYDLLMLPLSYDSRMYDNRYNSKDDYYSSSRLDSTVLKNRINDNGLS